MIRLALVAIVAFCVSMMPLPAAHVQAAGFGVETQIATVRNAIKCDLSPEKFDTDPNQDACLGDLARCWVSPIADECVQLLTMYATYCASDGSQSSTLCKTWSNYTTNMVSGLCSLKALADQGYCNLQEKLNNRGPLILALVLLLAIAVISWGILNFAMQGQFWSAVEVWVGKLTGAAGSGGGVQGKLKLPFVASNYIVALALVYIVFGTLILLVLGIDPAKILVLFGTIAGALIGGVLSNARDGIAAFDAKLNPKDPATSQEPPV